MIYRLTHLPPSVNQMYRMVYRSGRGDRVKTHEYDLWLNSAGKELLPIKPIKTEKYELHIHLPKKMRGDLDGRAKGLIDLLVKCGATPDDKHLQKLTMVKSTDDGVIIEVIPIEDITIKKIVEKIEQRGD